MMTRLKFEELAHSMMGRRIAQVQYFEINYPFLPPGPIWNLDERFDSLDAGLALIMEDGDVFFITWGDEFIQYNISIKANPQIDRSQLQWWDVTDSSRWKGLVGQQIESVRVVWTWELTSAEGHAKLRDFPVDIELGFESNQHVYLAVLRIGDDDWPESSVGHVTVIFDKEVAEVFGVGLESFNLEDPNHLRQEAHLLLSMEDYRGALEFLRLAKKKTWDQQERRDLQEHIDKLERQLAGQDR